MLTLILFVLTLLIASASVGAESDQQQQGYYSYDTHIRKARQVEEVKAIFNETFIKQALSPTVSMPSSDYEEESDESDHIYYNMSVFTDNEEMFQKYYVDLHKDISTNNTQKHEHLQDAYRKAAGIKLNFSFPFYGHRLTNVTIATGGFLYLGDQTHSWLAATQYIAPLMANFDTMVDGAQILYAYSNDCERIVFEWSNVSLRDNRKAGAFTFQVSLWKTGNITFVYKDIPYAVSNISDSHHPCKIGISDAYLYNHKVTAAEKLTTSIQNKRVIHEYHRISIPPEKIKSHTVVLLKALPTCLDATNCADCQKLTTNKVFQCTWCVPNNSKESAFCTDQLGMNRKRQDFFEGGCQNFQKNTFYCDPSEAPIVSNVTNSPIPSTNKPTVTPKQKADDAFDTAAKKNDASANMEKIEQQSSGGAAFLTLFFILGISVSLWMVYAYYNPHTPSGQLLIKYRPSKWQIPSSHVRYSASIHM